MAIRINFFEIIIQDCMGHPKDTATDDGQFSITRLSYWHTEYSVSTYESYQGGYLRLKVSDNCFFI